MVSAIQVCITSPRIRLRSIFSKASVVCWRLFRSCMSMVVAFVVAYARDNTLFTRADARAAGSPPSFSAINALKMVRAVVKWRPDAAAALLPVDCGEACVEASKHSQKCAIELYVACAEAAKDLKQLELVDQVDRTDKAAATVQDLVAECTAAQNERDAARAARDAEDIERRDRAWRDAEATRARMPKVPSSRGANGKGKGRAVEKQVLLAVEEV